MKNKSLKGLGMGLVFGFVAMALFGFNGNNSLGRAQLASASLGVTLQDVSSDSNNAAKSLYSMTSAVPVNFKTSAGTDLFYLDEASQRVGIWTNTPQAALDINGDILTGSGYGAGFKSDIVNSMLHLGDYNGNNTNTELVIDSGNTVSYFVNSKVGIDVTNPTAGLHLRAGTAATNNAPLKFTSGTLMTAPEAGAVEFLADKFYGTITMEAERKEFTLNDFALTPGRVPFATTNGRLADNQNLTYDGSQIVVGENIETGAGFTSGIKTDIINGRTYIGDYNANNTGTEIIVDDTNADIQVTSPLRLRGYTVATLPAGITGQTAYVVDALAPTYLGVVVGGGSVLTPVFYNGTAWVAH